MVMYYKFIVIPSIIIMPTIIAHHGYVIILYTHLDLDSWP